MSKILLVDDNPDLLTVLKNRLEEHAHKVSIATNGQKGIQIAKTDKPDLIIMDVMMPEMSGGDAAKALQMDITTQNIPIIFLTAVTAQTRENETHTINVGGHFYPALAKPFDPEHVLAVVQEILSRQKQV